MPPSPETLAFSYPSARLERRHGPRGYADDADYKPFLRDEFEYRCAYCLCREVWFPDREKTFSVEHVIPRSVALPGPADYDTLAYTCCHCNAIRGTLPLPITPWVGLAGHLEVMADGTIRGLTVQGSELIDTCGLGRSRLVAFRKLIIDTLRILGGKDEPASADLHRRYLAYPDDLPDLSPLRPPGDSSRPGGIAQSAFARRQRGELPATY